MSGEPGGSIASAQIVVGTQVMVAQAGQAGQPGTNRDGASVNADEELAGYLAQAADLIAKQEYRQAIDILHALIMRPDSGYVRETSNGRYLSLRTKAVAVIGSMPPEGLKIYRTLHDGEARRRMDQAVAAGDLMALRRVCDTFLFTQAGPEAVDTLAEMYFDRGMFSQAGHLWASLRRMKPEEIDPAYLLAKEVAARHLAGEEAQAKQAMEELTTRHGEARAPLAGQDRSLVEFARSVRQLTPPAGVQQEIHAENWPGQGGIPDGIGRGPLARRRGRGGVGRKQQPAREFHRSPSRTPGGGRLVGHLPH